jgi:hypothetical protein
VDWSVKAPGWVAYRFSPARFSSVRNNPKGAR